MAASKGITRVDLYDAVHRKVGLSRGDSADLMESVLKEISNCIVRGETVKLAGFGTFTVRKKSQWLGRNPRIGIALRRRDIGSAIQRRTKASIGPPA